MDCFQKSVENKFNDLFTEKIDNPDFRFKMIHTLVECFHISKQGMHKEDKAIIILDYLFKRFSFDFTEFINRYLPKKAEKKKFLIALLYGLYYEDIILVELHSQNKTASLEYFMLQVLAEHASEKTLRKILNDLPLEKQIALISYVYMYYREGSFYILSLFEEFYLDQEQGIGSILLGLRRKYFDVHKLTQLITEQPIIDEAALSQLISNIQKHALNNTKESFSIFNELVPLMVDSPVRVYTAIEELKQKSAPKLYQPVAHIREQAFKERDSLKKQFDSFYTTPFSLEEFQNFVQLFGLEKQQPQFKFQGSINITNTLVDNLRILHQIFFDPLLLASLDQKEVLFYFSYVLNIYLHLDAMHRNPSEYRLGIDGITCGIPTKGKVLERQSTLPTILLGLTTMTKFLRTKIKSYPIFVYDQSDTELFRKNQRTINKLNRQYKSSVIHVSQEAALSLAKKIGVEELLNTTEEGAFGYGGMRNCVSLLTLLLKHAFQMGKKSLDEVLSMDEKTLSNIFRQVVLEAKNAILMLDDDMVVPESNLFSYALFMKKSPHGYSYTYGYMEGRGTRFANVYSSLDEFLNLHINPFEHTKRLPVIAPASMSEYIMRPKICLNLPFGNEEQHSEGIFEIIPFLQTSWHLAGTRYPEKQLPTHFFVGIEKHLKHFIPYTIQIGMTRHLLDPLNQDGTSAMPWNQKEVRSTFTSLRDVFNFISNEKTVQEMQKMFWEHMDQFFHPGDNPMKLRQDIETLIHMDVEGIIKSFRRKEKLTFAERKSLKNIGEIYRFYQQDAKYMWEFSSNIFQKVQGDKTLDISEVIEQEKGGIEKKYSIKLQDYPITQGFYLLFQAVGAAQFNLIVSRV